MWCGPHPVKSCEDRTKEMIHANLNWKSEHSREIVFRSTVEVEKDLSLGRNRNSNTLLAGLSWFFSSFY